MYRIARRGWRSGCSQMDFPRSSGVRQGLAGVQDDGCTDGCGGATCAGIELELMV
jgi:hypothetical protein